jgi:hypothetical protein
MALRPRAPPFALQGRSGGGTRARTLWLRAKQTTMGRSSHERMLEPKSSRTAPLGARTELATQAKTHRAQGAAPARYGRVWLPPLSLAGVGADEESALHICHVRARPTSHTVVGDQTSCKGQQCPSSSCIAIVDAMAAHPVPTPVGPPLDLFFMNHKIF